MTYSVHIEFADGSNPWYILHTADKSVMLKYVKPWLKNYTLRLLKAEKVRRMDHGRLFFRAEEIARKKNAAETSPKMKEVHENAGSKGIDISGKHGGKRNYRGRIRSHTRRDRDAE